MSSSQIEIQLVLMLVSVACALPGVFLILRKLSLISDAISHSILPGVVIGFLITQDLTSPLLIVLAAGTGMLTVILVELLQKSQLVKEDTAIGLVFPALFSIGVLLIALKANDIHLDIDAVLLGEVAFVPFNRYQWFGYDMGPKAIWVMGVILMLIVLLLLLFFKELKLVTFDTNLAKSLGFMPALIHYGLMGVSSVTIVGAFDSLGAVLVVGLMIVPAAIAYLLTESLVKMLWISSIIGACSSVLGYWWAHWLDASIAGAIATLLGLIFVLVFLFSPKTGYVSKQYIQYQQKKEIWLLVLLLHLSQHTDENEKKIAHLKKHMNWSSAKSKKILNFALLNNFISIEKETIFLTEKGLEFCNQAVSYITNDQLLGIEKVKKDYFLFRG